MPQPPSPSSPTAHSPPVAVLNDGATTILVFPRRLGAPVCEFFSKTGHCRFGETCRFDHPPAYAVRLNSRGLPMRPGATLCAFYQRCGECKFGPSCKFDHPELGYMPPQWQAAFGLVPGR